MASTTAPMPTVYLETTIVSYLAARPSRDVVVLGNQEVTRQWWETRRHGYRLVISTIVLEEATSGDPVAASRRLDLLKAANLLELDAEAENLADEVCRALQIPDKARLDGYHIAYAMHYQIDYLLTWNCTHLANGAALKRLAEFARREGVWLPIIVTPLELMES